MSIDINEALKKISAYISKIDELLRKSYKEGSDKRRELDTAIQNFVRVTFPDGKEKLGDYRKTVRLFHVGYGMSEKEKQEDYILLLKKMRNHLVAYKEELQLRLASRKKSSKLDKIEKNTRILEAEAKRRAAVVEVKRWGTVIELISVLREELKERSDLSQEIIGLRKDVKDIKSMLVDLNKALERAEW